MVEGEIGLGNETVPFGEWKRRIDGGESGNKMVFPSLYGAFGGISTVAVWGDALKIDVVFGERCFDGGRTLVVDDVEFGGITIGVKEFVGFEPRITYGAAESVG